MSSPSTDPGLRLTPALASQFACIALGHVTREFPNKMDHVISGPDDIIGPRAAHPIFYGSFDWHSCVHGYWLLARLARRFPDISAAPAIEDVEQPVDPRNRCTVALCGPVPAPR